MVKRCNRKECLIGEQKIRESRKHGLGDFFSEKVGKTGVATLVTTRVFPLRGTKSERVPQVPPRRRRRRRRCPLLPLLPSAAVAAAAVGRYCCHLRPLPPPVTTAATVNCRHRRCWPLQLPPAIVADRCRFRRHRPLLMPPLASATKNEQIQYL